MAGIATGKVVLLDQRIGRPGLVSLPEAGSQSFKAKQFVKLVADGGDSSKMKVTACAGGSDELIYGIAEQDASGTEDTMLLIQPLDADSEFSIVVHHDTPASAVTSLAELTKTMDMAVASNVCLIDCENDTHNVLFIKRIDPLYPVGTQYGRYIASVMHSHLQAQSVA